MVNEKRVEFSVISKRMGKSKKTGSEYCCVMLRSNSGENSFVKEFWLKPGTQAWDSIRGISVDELVYVGASLTENMFFEITSISRVRDEKVEI